MKNKILKTIVALMVAATLTVLCMPVSLAAEYSGTTEGGFTWHFDESTGTMTVSGSGEMEHKIRHNWDGENDGNLKVDLRPLIKEVVLSEGITSVGGDAFYGFSALQNIEIPKTVTKIEGYAFYGCKSLESITIPDGVTELGAYCFIFCEALTSVEIPDSVTQIGLESFMNCKSLTKAVISDNVETIPENCFKYCENLTDLKIGKNVKVIEDDAFGYTSLKQIILPEGLEEIGSAAFQNSLGKGVLESIYIPKTVKTIGWGDIFYSHNDSSENLKNIYYGGTEAEWETLFSNTSGNFRINGATLHYNSKASDLTVGGNSDSNANNNDSSAESYDVETTEKNSDGKDKSDSGSNGAVTVIIIVAVVVVIAGAVLVVMKKKKA